MLSFWDRGISLVPEAEGPTNCSPKELPCCDRMVLWCALALTALQKPLGGLSMASIASAWTSSSSTSSAGSLELVHMLSACTEDDLSSLRGRSESHVREATGSETEVAAKL